jgi:AraC family transcriptional regulator
MATSRAEITVIDSEAEIAPRVLIAPQILLIAAPVSDEAPSHAATRAKALVLLSGAACPYEIDGTRVDLAADRILLVDPLRRHRPIARRSAEPSLVLSLAMTKDWIEARKPGARAFGTRAASLDAATRASLRRLTGLLVGLQPSDRGLLDATMDLAACVVDAHATAHPAPQRLAFDFRIRRAVQIATADPHRIATVDAMLAASDLSRSRFFELFRDCVGVTPHVFVDAHAGDLAIAALANSDDAVARVARDLGFANPDGFTRIVRRATGLTPRDFRRAAVRL